MEGAVLPALRRQRRAEEEAIEAEVNLLRWLAGAGIAVAPPVRSRDGRFVETVATDAGLCHAVVFAGLAGAQRDLGELDGARLRAWGAALGKLHAALKAYPGAGAAARGDWRDQLALAGAWIPGDAPAVRQELDQIAASLAALPANAENHGLIHGDFELDNLYWHDRGSRYWTSTTVRATGSSPISPSPSGTCSTAASISATGHSASSFAAMPSARRSTTSSSPGYRCSSGWPISSAMPGWSARRTSPRPAPIRSG